MKANPAELPLEEPVSSDWVNTYTFWSLFCRFRSLFCILNPRSNPRQMKLQHVLYKGIPHSTVQNVYKA
jgi:hypothetical protein